MMNSFIRISICDDNQKDYSNIQWQVMLKGGSHDKRQVIADNTPALTYVSSYHMGM